MNASNTWKWLIEHGIAQNQFFLFENAIKHLIIHRYTFFFQTSIFLQQLLALPGQSAAFFSIGMHYSGIHMLFGGFNFTPDSFVRHLHHFGGLINGSGLFDILQDFRSAVADDDVVMFINYPLAGS
jgi:hypothetical protein